MKIVKPSIEIIDMKDETEILQKLERIGRVCYKSESRITVDSAEQFVRNLIKRGHESVIEHESVTVKVICDRGVSHEIVRHRIASYSQESTRYCNYINDRFGGEITIIEPNFLNQGTAIYDSWRLSCETAEADYFDMLNYGLSPQEARTVLPNSLKTEIVITMNLREWRHFFRLRTSKEAHPQMREVANMLLQEFRQHLPVIFDDLEVNA